MKIRRALAAAFSLAMLASLTISLAAVGCAPEPESEPPAVDDSRERRAAELLQRARKATRAHRFEQAEKALEEGLSGLPETAPVYAELIWQRDYRIPRERFGIHLRAHEQEAVAEMLERLEDYVERYPERVEEARQVAAMRRSAGYLELSINTAARGEMAMLRPLLSNILIDVPELPESREELAQLLEQMKPYYPELDALLDKVTLDDVVLRDDEWRAVFSHDSTGQTVVVPLGYGP